MWAGQPESRRRLLSACAGGAAITAAVALAQPSLQAKQAPTTRQEVYVWGSRKCIPGGAQDDVLRPTRVEWFECSSDRWEKLALGPSFGAALDAKGALHLWGEGAEEAPALGPLRVDAQGEGRGQRFVDVQCSADKIFVVTAGGRALIFDSIPEQLRECAASPANPHPPLRLAAGRVPGLPQPGWFSGRSRVAQMSIGHSHAAFVTQGGEVFCIGDNDWGQCGVEPPKQKVVLGAMEDRAKTRVERATKVAFPEGSGPIVSVAVGGRHTLASNAHGRTFTFGDDRRIQLGLGDTRSINVHDERNAYAVIRQDQLSSKEQKGGMRRNVSYKYYDPHMQSSPVETVAPVVYNRPPYPAPSFVACGEDFTIAAHVDSPEWYTGDDVTNVLVGCGENRYGQCGRSQQQQQQPWLSVRLPKKSRTLSLTCGKRHCLALLKSGDLYAWGYGLEGQLGHGKRSMAPQPVKVGVAAPDSGEPQKPVKKPDGTLQYPSRFQPLPGRVTHVITGPCASAVICEVPTGQ